MMDQHHNFKRCIDGKGCAFCNDLWPPVDGLVSKFQFCELCGVVIHSSCKSLGNKCIPCIRQNEHVSGFVLDRKVKGQLHLKLRQAFDMGGSAGNILYGVWKYSNRPFIRTGTAAASENDCVWEENIDNIVEIPVDFSNDLSVDLKLEIWNSYFEIFDKKLFSSTISILPAVKYSNYRLERWFALQNLSTGHVGKILIEISFISNATLEMEQMQDELAAAFDLALKEENEKQKRETSKQLNSPQDGHTNAVDDKEIEGIIHPTNEDADDSTISSIHTIPVQLPSPITTEPSSAHLAFDRLVANPSPVAFELSPQVASTTSVSDSDLLEEHPEGIKQESRRDAITCDLTSISTGNADELKPISIQLVDKLPPMEDISKVIVSSIMEEAEMTTPLKPISGSRSNTSNPASENSSTNSNTKKFQSPDISVAQEVCTNHVMETPFVSLDLVKESTVVASPAVQVVASSVKKNSSKPSPPADSAIIVPVRKSNNVSNSPELVSQTTRFSPPLSLSENIFSAVSDDVHRVIKSAAVVNSIQNVENQDETLLKQIEQGVNNVVQRWTTLWQGHNILPHPSNMSLSMSSPELKRAVDKNNEKMSDAFIGLMHIHLLEVVNIFSASGASEYYCGISVDGRDVSFSTPVSKVAAVSSSSSTASTAGSKNNPKFDCKFSIGVPHFRSSVHIILIEARSKRKVGFATITPFEIMQRTADTMINSSLYPAFHRIPIQSKQGGVGVSTNTGSSGSNSASSSGGEKDHKEEGYFHVNIHFEENQDDYLWSSLVKLAPSGLEEEMSMERLSTHIARFTAIIELLSGIYTDYLRIMDWSDPIYTSTLLLIFLFCTLRVPAEYGLSGVMFFLVLSMTKSGMRRRYGAYKHYYVSKGKKDPSLEYVPLAKVKISLIAFKHPHRPSASNGNSNNSGGISGEDVVTKNPPVKVTFLSMKEKDNSGSGSETTSSTTQTHGKEYYVGCLGEAFTSNDSSNTSVPTFVSAFVNRELNRRDGLIQNVFDPWPVDLSKIPIAMEKGSRLVRTRDIGLVYPILQPLTSKVEREIKMNRLRSGSESAQDDINSDCSAHSNTSSGAPLPVNGHVYLPWSENTSSIKLTLMNDHEEESETVIISLRDIVNTGNPNHSDWKKCTAYELVRWYEASPIQQKFPDNPSAALMLNDLDGFLYDDYHSDSRNHTGNKSFASTRHKKQTEVLVRIYLEIPDERKTFAPNEDEKTTSFILQQALSDHKVKETSTLAVLWNMRDHVRYVQNVMNNILDWIESFKNLFNWTSPIKTLPIYLSVIVLWLLTIFISGRILILLWGLYQFFYIFLPIPDGNEYVIRFQNIVNSLPNDDDLEQIYAKERKVFFEAHEKQRKKEFRESLLSSTLPIVWCGNLQIKMNSGNMMMQSSSQGYRGANEWSTAYLIIQGKRILWWKSESEAEEGKQPPQGQIILTGFAGITQVSPLDLRQASDPSKLTAIFGQDFSGQPIKVSLHFEDLKEKMFVESIIHKIAN